MSLVLLAAFEVFLHRYSGQDEIVLGSPTSGRTRPEFAGVVGDFINVVLLRSLITGSHTFKAVLGQVSQTTREAIAHQDFPFSLLVERLRAAYYPAVKEFCRGRRFPWGRR
jgi:non-ribosomal peptide synthetase component F